MTSSLMPTYARADVPFIRGEGSYLFTQDGRRYLDFATGIAVNTLGHAHPKLVAALKAQAEQLWHLSNLYPIPGQARLADRLCANSFAEVAFFCNSGAEAVEAAIKTARKYFHSLGQGERYRLITFKGAFHGRTLATIAAGGQAKHLEGFGPQVPGFDQVPLNDLGAVEAAITEQTAGVLLEVIQGEGGVRAADPTFVAKLRALCDARGLLLILDEVQTGMGRLGTLFGYQRLGITPDILATAKGIGGGFPLGACLATRKAARGMTAGSHGSTFGGNPLAMAVGNAVLDVLLEPGFLQQVQAAGQQLRQGLEDLCHNRHNGLFSGVRGDGLMLGLECRVANNEVVAALLAEHLLAVAAGDNVVRLLPPLNIGDSEISQALAAIDRAADRLQMEREDTALTDEEKP